MDKNGILRCGVVQMLSIKVPFVYETVYRTQYYPLSVFYFEIRTNFYSSLLISTNFTVFY